MANSTFIGSHSLTGELLIGDGAITNAMVSSGAAIARTKLEQNALQVYVIPWSAFRIHDAIESLLPQPPSSNNLGWPATQTIGTVSPYLTTEDLKATTTTDYARFQFQLPPEYDSGQTVTLRLRAGMKTTVAGTSATVDAQVYKADRNGGVGADICATAAQSCNSLTPADLSFTITPTGLVPGDWFDVRLALAVVDAATGTAVIGCIYEVAFLLDIRG